MGTMSFDADLHQATARAGAGLLGSRPGDPKLIKNSGEILLTFLLWLTAAPRSQFSYIIKMVIVNMTPPGLWPHHLTKYTQSTQHLKIQTRPQHFPSLQRWTWTRLLIMSGLDHRKIKSVIHIWWEISQYRISYQAGADLVSFGSLVLPLHCGGAVRLADGHCQWGHLARHHGAQHGAARGERGARHCHRDCGQLQGKTLTVTHSQCRHLLLRRQLDDQDWGELAVILCTQSLILAAGGVWCPENVGSCYSLLNFTFRCSAPQDCWHTVTCLPLLRGKAHSALQRPVPQSEKYLDLRLCVDPCLAPELASLPGECWPKPASPGCLSRCTSEGVKWERGDRNSPRCWTLAVAHSTWEHSPPLLRLCNMTRHSAGFLDSQVPLPPPALARLPSAGDEWPAGQVQEKRGAWGWVSLHIRCQYYVRPHLPRLTLAGPYITILTAAQWQISVKSNKSIIQI